MTAIERASRTGGDEQGAGVCADFDEEMADAVYDNAGLGLLETELEVEFEVLTQ
jgi:hypothetical protein